MGVDCLQTAVSLCSTLELHDRCGEMLEPLTGFVCPEDGGDTSNIKKKKSRGVGKSGSATRYNLAHLMCIEDVLKNGFELASQSQDCWKYIMRYNAGNFGRSLNVQDCSFSQVRHLHDPHGE